MTPYRTQELVVSEPPKKLEVVKKGFIVRVERPKKTHECNQPGSLGEWWHNLIHGDVWICKCGKAWQLNESYTTKKNRWDQVSDHQRDTVLREAGMLNPWLEIKLMERMGGRQ
jgi:hypothetical protein